MPWERDADMRVYASEGSAQVTSDGNYRQLRATRLGAPFMASALDDLIRQGYGFCAGIGLLSAGEALQAAAVTTLRPSLWVRVPTGTTIRPFYGGLQVEDSGAAAAFEAVLGFVGSDVGDGTSSAADFGPVNLTTGGNARTTECVCRQEATGDVLADITCDLWRVFLPEDNVTTADSGAPASFEWNPRALPALVGPATLAMYIGSSAAPTATAQLQWVEEPTAS